MVISSNVSFTVCLFSSGIPIILFEHGNGDVCPF